MWDHQTIGVELFELACSLCAVAAVHSVLGVTDRAECLLAQAGELLAERAQRLEKAGITLPSVVEGQ